MKNKNRMKRKLASALLALTLTAGLALPAGAAFSAAGWVLFSFFFSVFVENFSNYATIYGSLTAIIILMMWLYFCMYILLIGGEVSMWLQHSSVRQDLRTLYHSRRISAQKGQSNGKKTKKCRGAAQRAGAFR